MIIRYVSMFALIFAGVYFIIEGSRYIALKRKNPQYSDKMYVAGVLTIILGVISLAFAILHFYFPMEIVKA